MSAEGVPFGETTLALARRVIDAAVERGASLSTAESCTGGLVAGALTAVAGSSEAVLGGVVSYALSAKEALLGVDPGILEHHGAVSAECARAMAEGSRAALGSSLAVATTGIAGPGGEEPGKPVGTVWFAVAFEGRSEAVCCVFEGTRGQVRLAAVDFALALLEERLVEAC